MGKIRVNPQFYMSTYGRSGGRITVTRWYRIKSDGHIAYVEKRVPAPPKPGNKPGFVMWRIGMVTVTLNLMDGLAQSSKAAYSDALKAALKNIKP